MKNIKKLIIILIILMILIITIIGILINLRNVASNTNLEGNEYTPDVIEQNALQKVTIRNDYYTVKNIVDQYYASLCNLNKTSEDILMFEYDESSLDYLKEEISKEKDANKNKIYNFFDENYIQNTGLTINNIQEKLGNYNNLHILIEDMYMRDITITLKVYFVSGIITEKDNLVKNNFQLMLAIDSDNSTFNMYTSDYIKKYNLFELSKEDDFNENIFNISNIENRKYNKYEYKVVSDEIYAKELLKTYSQSIKYNNIDYSYSKLDEGYRENKFRQVSDYEKYIQENKKAITTATLQYYKDNIYEDYRQYICVDKNENYYIFNETSIMNYTLVLDNYTINLPEFIEKYNKANNQEKVGMNIEKVISAINNKDYTYVYSKLDNTFKNNKFSTEGAFENYIKNNFFEINNIEYLELSQEGNVYIYKTKITEKNATTSGEKQLNIIMQLGNETDFTMSFNIE